MASRNRGSDLGTVIGAPLVNAINNSTLSFRRWAGPCLSRDPQKAPLHSKVLQKHIVPDQSKQGCVHEQVPHVFGNASVEKQSRSRSTGGAGKWPPRPQISFQPLLTHVFRYEYNGPVLKVVYDNHLPTEQS